MNVMSTPAVGGGYLVIQPTVDNRGRGEWRGAKDDKENPRCAVYCYDLRAATKP